MKNKSIFGIILLTVILGFSTFSCNSGGTSSVTIRINLGLQNASAFNAPESSIIDRVLRFFAKNAEAAPPSHIGSITLNITGEGMDKITLSYSPPPTSDTITLEVPSGDARTFELLAYTASATLRGVTTRNLVGGSTVTIPIQMGLYETKIVIPDSISSFGTPRIVQIDDMIGTGLLQCLSISGIVNFRPNDIDFDSQGKIFVANNFAGTGDDVICRIDTINGENPFIFGGNSSGHVAIAIDRINGIVYSARTTALERYTLSGSNLGAITFSPAITFTNIRGLAVDGSGTLYIAATTSLGARVIKCTPGNPSTNVIQYSTYLNTPWDVIVKNNNLYAANFDGADGYKILQLDLNLNLLGYNGNQSTSADSVPGNFYGPKRFLAILNRGLYIIDEASMNESRSFAGDRLVYFNDISLSGWQPSTGVSIDFWWQC